MAARTRPRGPAVAATLALGAVLLATIATAGPDAERARVIGVAPARDGGVLVCSVATAGLPGPRLLSSMRSGLVSAVDLDLELLDGRERVVAGNRLTLRLAFDLWEEVFAVERDGATLRFADLAALTAHLADLRALPVAPLAALRGDGRFRVRVGLSLHPVAPSELARVGEVIEGEPLTDGRSGGGREVSFSVGRLIRLFYRGGERPPPAAEGASDWFVPGGLRDAED